MDRFASVRLRMYIILKQVMVASFIMHVHTQQEIQENELTGIAEDLESIAREVEVSCL